MENEKDILVELDELKDENGNIDKDQYIAKLNDHLNEQRKKAEADAKIGKELLDELEAEGKGENISMNDFIKEISESDAEDK